MSIVYDDIQTFFTTGKKGPVIMKNSWDRKLEQFSAWKKAKPGEIIPYEAFLIQDKFELTPEEIEIGRNLASQISIKEIKNMKFDDISKAKFIHLRDPENEKRVLTICYVPFSWGGATKKQQELHREIYGDTTSLCLDRKKANCLAISYSMCHPDDQFVKKIANHKSLGHLNSNSAKYPKLSKDTPLFDTQNSNQVHRKLREEELFQNWNLLVMAEMEKATNYRARQIARHHLKLWKEEEDLEQDPNP